jgi:hypothetical protein
MRRIQRARGMIDPHEEQIGARNTLNLTVAVSLTG